MRREQTYGEEIANSVTHGIGAICSLVALGVLIFKASTLGDVWHIVSFSVFGISLLFMYLSSTFYHSFRNPKVKKVFRVFDHAAIYILIAGTYTPFALISLRGSDGWLLFSVLWTLALVGIIFKSLFVGRFGKSSTLIYILMGWMMVLFSEPAAQLIPQGSQAWLLAGGLFYTLGTIFYIWYKMPFHHMVWHLFVIGGSVCHVVAILGYLLPGALV